jgi:hypothetical protein
VKRLIASRLATLTVIVAVIMLSVGTVAAAPAARSAISSVSTSVSPDFTCPSGIVCFFSGPNETDSVCQVASSPSINGKWLYIPGLCVVSWKPDSVRNKTGDALWLYAKNNHDQLCVYPGDAASLGGVYGYMYIQDLNYCDGLLPGNPP